MVEQSAAITTSLKRWHEAQRALNELKSRINGAECELRNATDALGKQLCPEDAVNEEEFSIWVRTEGLSLPGKEMLLTVRKVGPSDYRVGWRKRTQQGKTRPAGGEAEADKCSSI